MITLNSPVYVGPGDVQRRVQDLEIGELIYNPVSDGYDEIVDILQRSVLVNETANCRFSPVVLEKDLISDSRPASKLFVSQQQEILTTFGSSNSISIRQASLMRAHEISQMKVTRRCMVTYFAIFFEKPRFLDVEGLLLRAYTLRDLSYA